MKIFYLLSLLSFSIIHLKAQTLELVKDINPGTANSNVNYRDRAFLQDTMIFAATSAAIGREVYVLKNDSVSVLKDVSPGGGGSNPGGFFNFKNEIHFFAAKNNALEIWKTDGTEAGTTSAITFSGSTFIYNDIFIVSRDEKFYFTRNDRIYVSDGTQSGTLESPQSPVITFQENFPFASLNVDRFEDGIAFIVDVDTAFQLFSAKDTTIELLGTINVSSQESFSVLGPFEVNAGLVLAVRDGAGDVGDLYLYDKLTGLIEKYSDTKIVARSVNRISDSRLMITTENECYATTGTKSGTYKILSTAANPSSGDQLPFIRIGNAAMFHGGEPFMADLVNATNGTTPGTRLIMNIPGNGISNFVSKGSYAFWINDLFFNGTPEVRYADISSAGATLLYTHPSAFTNVTYEINPIGVTSNKIYFAAKLDDVNGNELYALEHNIDFTTSTQEITNPFYCQLTQDRSQSSFKINIDGNHHGMIVSIHDALGRLLSSASADEDEWIRLPGSQGVYVITIKTKEGELSRIIIQ
jgi:hypothetical protein